MFRVIVLRESEPPAQSVILPLVDFLQGLPCSYSFPSKKKTPPSHDAATAMFQSGGGAFRVTYSVGFPPSIAFFYAGQKLLRPECVYMFTVFPTLVASSQSSIKVRFVLCNTNGCPKYVSPSWAVDLGSSSRVTTALLAASQINFLLLQFRCWCHNWFEAVKLLLFQTINQKVVHEMFNAWHILWPNIALKFSTNSGSNMKIKLHAGEVCYFQSNWLY